MITLLDLGASFWHNYFGTKKSQLDAYSLTYDRIDYYWRETGPRFIVCADSPRSVRKEKHPTYKASREQKEPAAIDSLRSLQERIQERDIPFAQADGWEGDDVIATLTAKAWPEEVTIVGSEKDFFCLIDDERVSLVGKNGPITSAHCFEKFGVPPSMMTEFLAMVGDDADDIRGCKNCGPGRAAKLLTMFGSIEAIKAAVSNGVLVKGTIKGIGEATLASLHEWDPAQALELVNMRRDLPFNLWEILK